MNDAIHDASRAQRQAADPAQSTWVTANAGSGKTRVLTDRVARLLLHGTPPQRILCLTYTNAAAAHMQNQLFARLGEWVMLPDPALRAALELLGEQVPPGDADALRNARRLFARALETPGGLKIQTIHAFCAAILRQFPLEACVAPEFEEIDDRTLALLRRQLLDDMADGPDRPVFEAVAGFLSEAKLERVVAALEGEAEAAARCWTRAELLQKLDHGPDDSPEAILADSIAPGDSEVVAAYASLLMTGSPTQVEQGARLAALDIGSPDIPTLEALFREFLYGEKGGRRGEELFAPFSPKYHLHPPNEQMRKAFANRKPALDEFMARLEVARERLVACRSVDAALALQAFGRAYLARLDAAKQARGLLDFDALIARVNDLLSTSETAQWVLYRLDGGIDHILVDEAQDTSPEQWKVITRLAEEFTAGAGARDVARTVFVVGDEKQSIYSFQGADPQHFRDVRERLAGQLDGIGRTLASVELAHSFRSAPVILDFVDKVFDAERGLPIAGGAHHVAAFTDQPGRVDIWPPVPPAARQDPPKWNEIVTAPRGDDPERVLAERVARFVKDEIAAGRQVTTRGRQQVLHEGNVLVLLRERSTLFFQIIRALKAADLKVAGADRLKIGQELGVKDILALLQFVLTPEDDLSLACVLRSPICGVSEAALFRLAHGRKGGLWQELRATGGEFDRARSILSDMLGQADFLRPFEMIQRVLIHHGARARLVGRLGPQCDDALDALLSEALAYEDTEAPSLTGFLRWFWSEETTIKRELETEGRQVRVMTVHGAKGLEAPLVILPDAFRKLDKDRAPTLTVLDGAIFLRPSRAEACRVLQEEDTARRARGQAEEARGLYVGLTRAENWLVIAGVGEEGKDGQTVYNALRHAAEHAGAVPCEFEGGTGWRIQGGTFGAAPAVLAPGDEGPALPDVLRQTADRPKPPQDRLNPSGLGGDAHSPGDPDADAERHGLSARDYGTWLHLALEHAGLAGDSVARLLESAGCPGDAADAVARDAAAIVSDPALGWVFGPGSRAEVAVTARSSVLGDRIIEGAIDRLVVTGEAVWIVDFKSNGTVPGTVDGVPDAYLRQLGAYAEAIAQVYPDRTLHPAILWTRGPALMEIPNEIVRNALARATIS